MLLNFNGFTHSNTLRRRSVGFTGLAVRRQPVVRRKHLAPLVLAGVTGIVDEAD